MTVDYEWLVEEVSEESGDIINVSHWDSAGNALRFMDRRPAPDGCRYEWGLCRDSYYPNDTRSWAYVEGGKLPASFEDAGGAAIAKVPARYHKELASAQKENAA